MSRPFRASSMSIVLASLLLAACSSSSPDARSSGSSGVDAPDGSTSTGPVGTMTPVTPDGGALASDGGDSDGGDAGATLAAQTLAATTTAATNSLCTAVQPFYWEIGDTNGLLASASVGTDPPVASTVMAIASASKWIFGGYAVEKMGGAPAAQYIPLFNFTSGYVGFTSDVCPGTGTVDDCLAGANGMQTASAIGKFEYNGAHLQELAHQMGLGADDNAALTTEVLSQVGTEIGVRYSEPQPAGGLDASATQYALYLRKLLVGSATPLKIATMLGADSVCTNPNTCPTAISSPIPGIASSDESWHYGLAHWIEDDPTVGDGSFSSPGAFGFYPWVNSTRTLYGVLARKGDHGHAGYDSARCGRLIRKAFTTGVAQ